MEGNMEHEMETGYYVGAESCFIRRAYSPQNRVRFCPPFGHRISQSLQLWD